MLGGLCVGFGRFYNNKNNILLSAGILFVAAGRSSCTTDTVYTHKLLRQQIHSVQYNRKKDIEGQKTYTTSTSVLFNLPKPFL